jgi:hypothetical protein
MEKNPNLQNLQYTYTSTTTNVTYAPNQQTNNNSSVALSDEDVTDLVARMKKRGMSDKMVEEVELTFGADVSVKAKQAYNIVKAISNSNSQKKACVKIYPKLSDKHNFGVVLDAISMNSTKSEVKKELGL